MIRPEVKWTIAAILGVLVACAAPCRADDDVISVLSYNVHGLCSFVAKDSPRDRVPTIAWLANKYDVVLFQELFEYGETMDRQMAGTYGVRGNGMGWDPRRVVAKILLSPVALLYPHCWPPYGAGVSTFVRAEYAVRGDVDREAYGTCDGWFGDYHDCWANKGLLRVRVRTPGGLLFDVYNTHLDAGPGRKAMRMRSQQLSRLATEIERQSGDGAVVVGGDFNLWVSQPGDREAIAAFRRRLGLRDSGAGPEIPFWRERDFILYRSGTDVTLEIDEMGEAQEFVNRNRALSDHPAVYVNLRVSGRGADAAGGNP